MTVIIDAPKRKGPTKKATEAYHEALWAAVESGSLVPEKIAFDAYRTAEIVKQDREVYRRRLAAKHELDVMVPELQNAAAQLERDAASIVPWGQRRVEVGMTIAQVWELIQAHANHVPHPEVFLAQTKRSDANAASQGAYRVLQETADPTISAEMSNLAQRATEIASGTNSRAMILGIDGAIAKQRALVDAIARGDSLNSIYARPVLEDRQLVYQRERDKLSELLDKAALKDQAAAEQQQAAAALAEIRGKQRVLDMQRLDPRKMKWG